MRGTQTLNEKRYDDIPGAFGAKDFPLKRRTGLERKSTGVLTG
jgi:hypothetical protein